VPSAIIPKNPFLLRKSTLLNRLSKTASFETPVTLTYWGWQLTQSGWGKLHNLANVTNFFSSLSLPYPAQTALFISCVEFFGGIFLGLGLLSRITALVLTVNMFVAYAAADREALPSVFSDPDKFCAAAPYTFLIASVIMLLFGPGKLALDALVRQFVGTLSLQETSAVSR
jgi:putative oxidoreductase